MSAVYISGQGRARSRVTYVELGTHRLSGRVEGDKLEAQEVVSVLDTLGNSNGLDTLVYDLGNY